MNNHFQSLLAQSKSILFNYDGNHIDQKIQCLKKISMHVWKDADQLTEYLDMLLFLAVHPENEDIKNLVEQEFLRISRFFKNNRKARTEYQDTGLPFTKMITRFSHELLVWINKSPECKMIMESFEEGGIDLNTMLNMTLPAIERDETTAGLSNDELLVALSIHPNDHLTFLLNECSKFNQTPLIKDFLWDSLKLWIQIEPKVQKFSRIYNRLSCSNIFYQQQLIKKFDHVALINKKLPLPKSMSDEQVAELSAVIKKSLLLTMRETDPSTYMDITTLKYYSLEQGISIALYGMTSERQLPLQSYIGYTLFKNAYPVAYGGSWVFGKTALFGLNIFESFRGGESGYIMCQLLRTYSQVFNIQYFEVDPYQFGLDNPDGIKSGAFWFYYRYGFRPVDKKLARLSENEWAQIKSNPAYRTGENTLIKFTASNIALRLGEIVPTQYATIGNSISTMIRKKFKSDRIEAVNRSVEAFSKNAGKRHHFTAAQIPVLTDMSLMASAMNIRDKKSMEILVKLIKLKPIDPFRYNHLLCQFFDK